MNVGNPALLIPAFDIRQYDVDLATTNILCEANPQRVGLVFAIPVAGQDLRIDLTTAVAAASGLRIPPERMPYEMWFYQWGSAVQRQWFCAAGGLGTTVRVIEITYTPGRLKK